MKEIRKHISKAAILSLVAALLIVGVAWALSDSILLKGYRIDFISVEELADGHTTRWTYAITDQEADSPGNGLSHWVLGLGNCGYQITAPPATIAPNYPIYTTPTNLPVCVSEYNCIAAEYEVEYGLDPTTGVDGIKFNNLTEQLEGGSPPNTHLFQIDLYTDSGKYLEGDTDIAVKTGGADQYQIGSIHGPICPPTAVSLVAFEGKTQAAALPMLAVAGVFTLVGGGTLFTLRRRKS